MLKLKAKIYQYTGIYLAQKEEATYMVDFYNTHKNDYEDFELDEGMEIGSWQADNGFYRRMSPIFKNYSRSRFDKNIYTRVYYKVVSWLHVFYLQLKDDLYEG